MVNCISIIQTNNSISKAFQLLEESVPKQIAEQIGVLNSGYWVGKPGRQHFSLALTELLCYIDIAFGFADRLKSAESRRVAIRQIVQPPRRSNYVGN